MRQLICTVLALIWIAPLASGAGGEGGARRYPGLEYARIGQLPLRMDLHVPASAQTVPVVIYIHGGDWMFGYRSGRHPLFLLNEGIAVASIDYRLAPRFRFPAQARDCRDALAFLHDNAARYRIDPRRIGAMGESAGGHLAALLGLATDNVAFAGTRKPKSQPRVRAIACLSGPMDIEFLGNMGDLLEPAIGSHPIQQLLGGRVSQNADLARLASPIRHVSADDPPMLLIYGERDFVVPPIEAQNMEKALRAAGVPVESFGIPQMSHDMFAIWQPQFQAPQRIARFFRENLTGVIAAGNARFASTQPTGN